MDLDETVLDNGTYQTYLYDSGQNHSTELFSKWVTDERASIRLVPGAKDFIQRMEALGVTVIYITNRPDALRDVTIETLAQWGINTQGLGDASSCRLLLKPTANRAKPRVAIWSARNTRCWHSSATNLATLRMNSRQGKTTQSSAARTRFTNTNQCGHALVYPANPMYGAYQGVLRGEPEQYLRRPKK